MKLFLEKKQLDTSIVLIFFLILTHNKNLKKLSELIFT